MDPLVGAALDRVNDAVTGLPWAVLEEIKEKRTDRVPARSDLETNVAKAVHAIDALRSALLSVRWRP